MSSVPRPEDLLPIGEVASRTGLSVSAVRFYADNGLAPSRRADSGHRRFPRSTIRRLSFVQIAQEVGYSLGEIRARLDELPGSRTPTEADWALMATEFEAEIGQRIEKLNGLRQALGACIGCGCLSLSLCAIWNRDDAASTLGDGPRYLLGNTSADLPSR